LLILKIDRPEKFFGYRGGRQPAASFFSIWPCSPTFIKIFFLKTILNEQQLAITIQRLSHQVLENHLDLENTVLIGIQPRGIYFSDRLIAQLGKQVRQENIRYGKLDITFYRDDVRSGLHELNQTKIPFSIENRNVILVDDVLWTGRTIRAALDALQDFGRPAKVELCVLIDRRLSRQLPIQADYTGRSIDSMITQKVKVFWVEKDGKDEVALL
jgi:pyrimidine operon attenuation protein / uracil phosphoribosyltransferase